jgi:hypothetical protein
LSGPVEQCPAFRAVYAAFEGAGAKKASDASNAVSAIGYLTVAADAEKRLCGGYLLLNHSGRPLEFHCTAPLAPNRAQTILYGSSLEPYLYGELIGRTLLEKGAAQVEIVLTDSPPAMSAETDRGPRIALAANANGQSDPSPLAGRSLSLVRSGELGFWVSSSYVKETNQIFERLRSAVSLVDWLEPFERIRLALDEAHRDARGKSAA